MKNLIIAISMLLMAVSGTEAREHSSARVYYGGGHHTVSHGGHYYGGSQGSSHRGGHYINPRTGNHYGRHK